MSKAHSIAFSKLLSKPKTKSAIWEHFGLPADEEGKVIDCNVTICRICMNAVSAKGGSTSNMISHIKLHHPIKYMEMTKKPKRNLPKSFIAPTQRTEVDDPPLVCNSEENLESITSELPLPAAMSVPLDPPLKKQKTLLDYQPLDARSSRSCTEAVTEFIAFTMQPYNVVERKPFIKMVKTLNPRYKLPGRKHFSGTAIPKLYNEIKERVEHLMAFAREENISLTTDCWTSVANTPYIAVTAHFIDQYWVLKSICLTCAHFESDHTYENICSMLESLLLEWNIDIKNVSSFTTDNGSNILKAVDHLKVTHVSCFGHNINIGINRALELPQLDRAIARLKKLQNSFSHSWKMKRDLTKAQEFLQVEVQTLPSACPTRWWSTLKLVRRFLENQLAICKVLQDHPKKKHLMPEGGDISALEDFVLHTKLVEEMTTTLSGDEYVTSSSIWPLYRKLTKSLEVQAGDSKLGQNIKRELLSALSERYELEPLKTTMLMSSLCDPRFRMQFTDNPEEVKEIAMEKMVSLYSTIDEPSTSSASMPEVPIQKKGLAKLLDFDDVCEKSQHPKDRAKDELDSYLSMPRVGLNTNPLGWWKSHQESFPSLKLLAKKYLAIQGTSVPSERVFSTGGNVITRQRAALLPKNAEMLIFLAQNKSV